LKKILLSLLLPNTINLRKSKEVKNKFSLNFDNFTYVQMQWFTPIKAAKSCAANIPIVNVGAVSGGIPACSNRMVL